MRVRFRVRVRVRVRVREERHLLEPVLVLLLGLHLEDLRVRGARRLQDAVLLELLLLEPPLLLRVMVRG